MQEGNAIQQVFNPATQRLLIRVGLFLLVGLAIALAVMFVLRLFKKTPGNQGGNTQGGTTNQDGTPATMPLNLKRLADDLKESSGWSIICNSLRCDTILAIAELPDGQLVQLGVYYKSMYAQTLRETFDSFYISGCCFKDAGDVVDAKLKSIQQRVKNLGI